MKNKKSIIIIVLIAIVSLLMGILMLTINNNSNKNEKTKEKFEVNIVNIEEKFTGDAKSVTKPKFEKTTFALNASLPNKTDTATYIITIKNEGNVDVTLENVTYQPEIAGSTAPSPITYTIISEPVPNEKLAPKETTTVELKAEYSSTLSDEEFANLTDEQKIKSHIVVLNYKKMQKNK